MYFQFAVTIYEDDCAPAPANQANLLNLDIKIISHYKKKISKGHIHHKYQEIS